MHDENPPDIARRVRNEKCQDWQSSAQSPSSSASSTGLAL